MLQKIINLLTENDSFVEIERGLLRNNGLTFPLIKNEYIYTKLKTQK